MNQDPYFSTELGVQRLLEQYHIHKNLIVAFDFDDTIFDYHKKGFTYPKVVELLLECQSLGFTLVMLTTTENDQHLIENVKYCERLGLHIAYVNTGPVMPKAVKPFFNVYLDDKAGLHQAYEILSTTIKLIQQEIQ